METIIPSFFLLDRETNGVGSDGLLVMFVFALVLHFRLKPTTLYQQAQGEQPIKIDLWVES